MVVFLFSGLIIPEMDDAPLDINAQIAKVIARRAFLDFGNIAISLDEYLAFFLEILDDETIPFEYIQNSYYLFLEYQRG